MLQGPVWNRILLFALPVAATGMLEQLFNALRSPLSAPSPKPGALKPWLLSVRTVPSSACS